MSSERALNQLKSVWQKAGLEQIPSPADIKGNMQDTAAQKVRKKSDRTARLDLRLRPDEKQCVELMAVREAVSINEIFSRMLALYEREHGRVELTSPKDQPDEP